MFEGFERGRGDSWLLQNSQGTESTGTAWSVVQVLLIVKCSTLRAIIRALLLFSVLPAQLSAIVRAGPFTVLLSEFPIGIMQSMLLARCLENTGFRYFST